MLGGTFLTYGELRAAIVRVTGVHRRAMPTPAAALRLAGRAGDLVKRVVSFDYPLTYESMVMATRACPYDSDATCRVARPAVATRRRDTHLTRFAGSRPAAISTPASPAASRPERRLHRRGPSTRSTERVGGASSTISTPLLRGEFRIVT